MNLSNAKRIYPYALPYKKYAFLNIVFNTLYALFSALSFVALIPMLEVFFGEENKVYEKPQWEGIATAGAYLKQYMFYVVSNLTGDSKVDALGYIIAMVLVLFMLKNLFNYLAIIFINHLRNGVLKDLRNKMYDKIVSLPLSYFSQRKKGDVIARITNDVAEFQNSYLSILELIVREPMTIVFTIAVMFGISVKLTIFVFLFIPISGAVISRVGKSLKKHSRRLQEEQGNFLSIVEETIAGLRIIKTFCAQDAFSNKFKESTLRFFSHSNNLSYRQNLSSPVSEFLGIVTIGVLLWFGGRMVLVEQSVSGAEFIAYMGLAYNILTPAKTLSKASYQLKLGNAAADRVMEVMEKQNEIVEIENAVEKKDFKEKIDIENISFGYKKEKVLKNFSLTIEKGKTVALVGQSGSGKSTIASLLNRFYDVRQGAIKIDGIDIKNLKINDLRSLIGLVSQESILFNDTIENNIKLGKKNATEQEVIKACEIANAYDFIKELPQGLKTNIGDNGGMLSGGQRQRICIARAVLKNPPIMILDEATSALDTESEKAVQVGLENMMKNRTSIVIAHRLSTIQNADEIVVMEKGQIVEKGTHNTLIEKAGVYKKLVELQSVNI